MKKIRASIVPLFAAAALVLAACKPIPTAKYDSVAFGDDLPTVLRKLGVERLDEAGGRDPFQNPGESFWHIEQTYRYFGVNGKCEQTLDFVFRNYIDLPGGDGSSSFHFHYPKVQLVEKSQFTTPECGTVIK